MAVYRGVGQVIGTGLENLANALLTIRKMQFQLAVQKAEHAARQAEKMEERSWLERKERERRAEELRNMLIKLGKWTKELQGASVPELESTLGEAVKAQREEAKDWLQQQWKAAESGGAYTRSEWLRGELERRARGITQQPIPATAITPILRSSKGKASSTSPSKTLGGETASQIRTGITTTTPKMDPFRRDEGRWEYPDAEMEALHKEYLLKHKLFQMGIRDKDLQKKKIDFISLKKALSILLDKGYTLNEAVKYLGLKE